MDFPRPMSRERTLSASGFGAVPAQDAGEAVLMPPALTDHPLPMILETRAAPADVLEPAGPHALHGTRGTGGTPSSAPAALAAFRDAPGREPDRTPVRAEALTGAP
ncbi:hypothetical protein [Streptomyces tritici]|uniref:hypothetical protein n=1 Tax=Streptomyces tritici TaxID=2054410 RepID=UPI003AF1BB99